MKKFIANIFIAVMKFYLFHVKSILNRKRTMKSF